jgi:hypothetical protein
VSGGEGVDALRRRTPMPSRGTPLPDWLLGEAGTICTKTIKREPRQHCKPSANQCARICTRPIESWMRASRTVSGGRGFAVGAPVGMLGPVAVLIRGGRFDDLFGLLPRRRLRAQQLLLLAPPTIVTVSVMNWGEGKERKRRGGDGP